MARLKNQTTEHQRRAAMMPRPGKLTPTAKTAEAKRNDDETLEEATLRLQKARADTEELDRQKRELELDVARGKLIPKDQAVDMAQESLLRAVAILEQIPERIRAKVGPEFHYVADWVEEMITQGRIDMADGK